MEKIIDLHMHTSCSDGALSPKEVIDKAYANGVSVISITDHDTVDAYNDELFKYAEDKGIKLIPGVEISTKTNKCGIHVLGYNIDLNNKEFLDGLFKLRNIRHDYLHNVSLKLRSLGYVIDEESLDKIEAVTKAHIALNVVENSKNYEMLKKVFGHIPDKGEFIETIMNEGCPAYVKKNTVSPSDAAKLIRKASGKVVLAHPVAYKYEDSLSSDDTLNIVKDMNADGLEANYIYVDMNHVKHNDVNFWKNFARENNLKLTVGSDFHKEDGLHPTIGLINDLELDSKEIKEILEWVCA